MSERNLTLSIETAIQGGSLALLQDTVKLDGWIGTREISRSEDVLDEINKLLERNSLEKESLGKIIVSAGPGSYTGVRIGMALGTGLKKALETELIGVYALEAMCRAFKGEIFDAEEIIAAVPIGRNQICSQTVKLNSQKSAIEEPDPQLSIIEEFLDLNCKTLSKKVFIFQRKLFLDVELNYKHKISANILIIDAGENVALLNAAIGIQQTEDVHRTRLIYAKENVFVKQ